MTLFRLIDNAVEYIAHTDQVWAKDLVTRLADALDALNKENAALLAENEKRLGCDHLDGPYRRVLAERDALQAQLDSMTTETRPLMLEIDDRGKVKVGKPRWQQRLVGPWVMVSDE